MRFTRGRVRELKNAHNSVTVQNRTHVYMNFFHHKDLGNHILQLCPKVVKHPVYARYTFRSSQQPYRRCFCTRELLRCLVIRDEKLEKGRKACMFLFNIFPSIMLSLPLLLFNLLLLSAPYNYVAHVRGLCYIWSPKQITGT